ncbi:AAA family ATPase [Saccharopolyspora sp. CA-218241]|uniref:AAA family ATPase n=1 Tax=Saccharopolyspora sp. CA-218241 TaxID=3240027 RepID=UPI003D98A296
MTRKHKAVLGRDEQLAALDGAVAGGGGALVVVRGPRGSGKSAVLGAVRKRWAERGVRTFASTATAAPGVFEELFDAVRRRIDEPRDVRWPPSLLDAVAAGSRLRHRDREIPEHNPLPLVHELTRALAHLVPRERTALLVDDVDRMDRTSAAALSALALGVRAAGVVVIATGGPGSAIGRWTRNADVVVDLPPLRDSDVAGLLGAWAGMRAPVDASVTRALLTGLGPLFGNPGTVRAALRALRAEGRLVLVDGHVCLRPAGEPIALPDDHELVAAVRDCGPAAAAVVRAVAVLGEIAAHDLPVLAVAAGTDVRTCGQVLDRLVDREVVRSRDGALDLPVPALGVAAGRATGRSPRAVHAAVARHLLAAVERGAAVDRTALADHLARAEHDFGDPLPPPGERTDGAVDLGWYAAVRRPPGADRRWSRALPTMMRLQLAAGRQHELADDLGAVVAAVAGGAPAPAADRDVLLFEVAAWWVAALLHEQRIGEVRDAVRVVEAVAAERGCVEQARRFAAALVRGGAEEVLSAFSALITAGTAGAGAAVLRVGSLAALLSLLAALGGEDRRFRRARTAWEAAAPAGIEGTCSPRLREAGAWGDHAAALSAVLGPHYRPSRRGAPHRYHHVVSAYHAGDWDAALSAARALETERGPGRTGPAHHLSRVVAAEICSVRGELDRAAWWLHRSPRTTGHLASWVRCGLRHRQGRTAEAVAEGRRDLARCRELGAVVGLERLLARLIAYSLQLGDTAGAHGLLGELRAVDRRARTGSAREMVLIVGGGLHADVGRVREGVELARRRRARAVPAPCCPPSRTGSSTWSATGARTARSRSRWGSA